MIRCLTVLFRAFKTKTIYIQRTSKSDIRVNGGCQNHVFNIRTRHLSYIRWNSTSVIHPMDWLVLCGITRSFQTSLIFLDNTYNFLCLLYTDLKRTRSELERISIYAHSSMRYELECARNIIFRNHELELAWIQLERKLITRSAIYQPILSPCATPSENSTNLGKMTIISVNFWHWRHRRCQFQ